MTKKLPLSFVAFLFIVAAFGQTIVSTTPENKKVILEEFTGVNCTFCPDGHAIAKAIQDANPGNVFLINIHAGFFAEPTGNQPNFIVPEGEGIRAFYGANSFPSGMINRHIFSGNSPVMGRGSWASSSNQILGQASYLNMAVEATLDIQTRELVVHVEGYYTDDSPVASNYLNVALVQNNTVGPQVGGGMGNNYVHQHRLVDLLTGQWGEEITTTSAGDFVDRTYTYTVPADYNDIDAIMADMELVTFMTETESEVISGNGVLPAITGITTANDANIKGIVEIAKQCLDTDFTFTPTVTIENLGQNEITSLDIDYSINGGTVETFTFTGSILALRSETIELPEQTITVASLNTIEVTIPSDENNANNSLTTSFEAANDGTGSITLTIETDQYANETSWRLYDSSGAIIFSGALGTGDNNSTVVVDYDLPAADCYSFSLRDSFGDGIFNGGGAKIEDSNGTLLFEIDGGTFGTEASENFGSDGILGVGDNLLTNVVLYPNPASTVLNIKNAENASIEIYDILGKLVITENNISMNQQIEVSKLQTGTYFVKIYAQEGQVSTEKFIIGR